MSECIESNIWFFPLTPNKQLTSIRLFTFHHAGGSTSMFRPWIKDITPFAEIIAIQLPGRGTRFAEPLLYNAEALIKELIKNFYIYLDKPFIFFGHSMGAIVCFELARALRKKGFPLPRHLIISATKAPQLPSQRENISKLSNTEFVSKLLSYNGIPSILLKNREMLDLYIPIIRADFMIAESYAYYNEPPLSCPITAFGGKNDPYLLQEEIFGWGIHTQDKFKYHFFEGDHFFLTKESYFDVVKILNTIVLEEISKLQL